MELTPQQIATLTLVATVFTYGLKLLATYFGYQPPKWAVSTTLFVVSLVSTVWWTPVEWPPLPPLGDIPGLFQYLAALLTIASPVLTFAFLVYGFLYSKVFAPITSKVRVKAKSKPSKK